jgi:pimeloyl-ACP methyl ester carboxylesterase
MANATAQPVSTPRPRRRNRFLRILGTLVIILVVLALIGAVYQSASAAADRRNYPPIGELVDIGDYSLHLNCTGEGSPTVILIAGAGNMYAHWDAVQTGASEFTRVCSYDRAGTGWSDYPASQPDMNQHIEDLHALLQASGEPGPYILVGHSMGGIQSRMYYATYPEDVRGMVLVDSSIEGQYEDLPSIIRESNRSASTIWGVCQTFAPIGLVRIAGLGQSYANAFPDYSETAKKAITATFNRTGNCRGAAWESGLTVLLESGDPSSLGDLPLIVLTRGQDEMQANPNQRFSERQQEQFREVQRVWSEIQADLATISTNSEQIIAEESGHFIQESQPELVVDAIRQIIERSE